MNETEAFAALALIKGMGAVKIRQLVQHFGSALEALHAPISQIKSLGLGQFLPQWHHWQHQPGWKDELTLIAKSNVQLLPFTHPQFPTPLLEIPDAPALLYVQGSLNVQDSRSIAIIGTRQASQYGSEMAQRFGKDLAARGFTVISGLARGVDTAAHSGALQRGRTIAVLGSGLNTIYPIENQSLASKITQSGALISEFPMTTPPDRQNFPQRNRIVSGLSSATLLIEAPLKSGAMNTMEKSFHYNRPLFALPGRADSENFRGNHLLIKSGRARLVETVDDLLEYFEDMFPSKPTQATDNQYIYLDKGERDLLEKMPFEEIDIDALALTANLPVYQAHTLLMRLVIKKAVKEFPGKLYKKLAAGNERNRQNQI